MIEEIKAAKATLIEKAKRIHPEAKDIETRAIPEEDFEVLESLIKKYNPKIILEVGTWIGTSAMAMDMISNGAKIYTCDEHNMCVYESPNVTFYHCSGKSVLAIMPRRNIQPDFIFIDAGMRKYIPSVLAAMTKDFVFVVHDYVQGSKGWRNMEALKKLVKNITIIKPSEKSTIAYCEVKR